MDDAENESGISKKIGAMEAWQQFLSQLARDLEPEVIDKWLRPLKVIRFDAGNLYLEATDSFQVGWFEEHIRPRLKNSLFNNNQRPIKVHLSGPLPKRPVFQKEKEPSRFSIHADPLNPEMTLDNLLVSPENLMAYRILSQLKEGLPFNPIYLFGPKGVGKTHLLMGAAAALQKQGKRVFFVRAETFTEHVVQAIRLGLMQEFRKIYRDIDALIIDDIHIFSKKTATQEEFFHTFNTLHTSGRLILISANTAPSSLAEIEPRLISRFEWGISIGLEKSDETALLKKKAALWKISLPDDVISFILEHLRKDPFKALQALSLRAKTEITLTVAKRLLADLVEEEQKQALTPEQIIKATAAHYGIRFDDLLGKSQMRECAVPRQVAMFLCRDKLKMPFQKIGELFSRDHSTVMGSVKLIQKSIEEKKEDLLSALSQIVTN